MFYFIIKDIKNIIYDPKSLMFILVMPIVLMSILGMSLQGVFTSETGSGVLNTNIAIVKEYDLDTDLEKVEDYLDQPMYGGADINLDEIDIEGIFFNEYLGSEGISEIISYEVVSLDEAKRLMEDKEISTIVVLPDDFIYNGYINYINPMRTKMKIEIIKSSDSAFTADIVEQVINGYVDMLNNQYAQLNTLIKVMVNNNMASAIDENLFSFDEEGYSNNVSVLTQSIDGGSTVDSFQYYSVAIMAMFLLYAASYGAISLYEEKKQFSMQRLEVSGNKVYALLTSNFFRVYGIVVLQSIAMIIYSSLVLGVSWGSVPSIITGILLSAFAISGIGTFVASLTLIFDNVNISNIFQFAFVQIMALLGGSFVPLEILPEGVQKLSVISLNTSVVNIYLNGMADGALEVAKPDILYLLVYGGVFILLSVIFFKASQKEVIA